MATDSDRRSYDTGASNEAQGNIQAVIARLELVIAARDAQVKNAMKDFAADGIAVEATERPLCTGSERCTDLWRGS